MDLRLASAVVSAKALKEFIRLFGGGATAAPGLLAEYIDPKSLKKLAKKYEPTILVTGTNGKTTTSRLVGNILLESDIAYIHNRSGSNLLRGIIGTVVDNIDLRKKNQKAALFEVDEATLPLIITQTYPKIIVFNNLFRDQLDRYGEVDKIRKIWTRALGQLEEGTVLILNADDHSIAHLSNQTRAKAVYFGIEDQSLSLGKLPHASDFTSCITCGSNLKYDRIYLAHLGRYWCEACGLKRPKPDVYAENIVLKGRDGFTATIHTPKGNLRIKSKLPGLYNVYNALASIAAGLVLGTGLEKIKKALEGSTAVFGRNEKVEIDGKVLFISLVKNPAGFNEILRCLFTGKEKQNVFFIINDLIADGRDVSWLWDVDFEYFTKKFKKIWVGGSRSSDMALRLKYAGLKIIPDVQEDLEKGLAKAIEALPKGETLYILPTYTAMLSLKKILADIGVSSQFWKE